MKKRGKLIAVLAVAAVLISAAVAAAVYHETTRDVVLTGMDKPVIYLYPEQETRVHVGLDLDGALTASYLVYPEGGWDVTAYPDGRIEYDGKSYRYLYWEGEGDWEPDFSSGFLIAPETALEFLEEKLTEIGLNEYEKQEMIVYWLPELLRHKYSLVSFQTEAYTEHARLEIEPVPDSMLRVFMAVRPVDRPIEISPQVFERFERTGFAVVEWGGTVVGEGGDM